MINSDYKTIRKAIERLNYFGREIEHIGDTKAIERLLARVSYSLAEYLEQARIELRNTLNELNYENNRQQKRF